MAYSSRTERHVVVGGRAGFLGRTVVLPSLDYESHASGLDRNELGALLVAAGLSTARDHALISLLALNGLRISEALGADIETLGLEVATAPSP